MKPRLPMCCQGGLEGTIDHEEAIKQTLATCSGKFLKARLLPDRYDGHFDGNAHRLPTMLRDTSGAGTVNSNEFMDQLRLCARVPYDFLNPGSRAHLPSTVLLQVNVMCSLESVDVTLGRPIA
jgi:hypothetical protein